MPDLTKKAEHKWEKFQERSIQLRWSYERDVHKYSPFEKLKKNKSTRFSHF